MQASTYSVKGNTGFDLRNRKDLPGIGDFRKTSFVWKNLCQKERSSCLRLRFDSVVMGAELGRMSVFRPSAKSRSVKAQANSGCFLTSDFVFD